MKKFFVFGNSHTQALRDALNMRKPFSNEFFFEVHWEKSERNGTFRGDLSFEDALRAISSLTEKDIVAIYLLGTAHNQFGLISHDVPFWMLNSDSGGESGFGDFIPEALMHDMFYEYSNTNRKILRLKNATKAKFFHLMTPPPKKNNEYLRQKLLKYKDIHSGKLVINSPSLRLKLYQIEFNSLRLWLLKQKIDLVAPPSGSLDIDGFLKEEFYGNDATHANASYGQLVLSQLECLN